MTNRKHALTCRAYGNYQPPYEDCTCGADGDDVPPCRDARHGGSRTNCHTCGLEARVRELEAENAQLRKTLEDL